MTKNAKRGESIAKIKEKRTVKGKLKEKAKAAPKELVRRGLNDGTERLRDKTISFKAKGLLSMMLSLPENWDYTISSAPCKMKA